jgi:maltose alpha-D-glucosyltransferase / alpha-amylase
MDDTTIDDKLYWYKDAIIYELHIKAYRDSNCDGVGDFEGLLEKLDYLQDLGITAIWLLPFYPSPLQDDGYDIADYYSINTAYGTIKQFRKVLDEAHKRNLKVITELVINHTSDQHPWFQASRRAPKGSATRNFYVWTDDPNQYKDARIIFQDFERSNWTWDDVAQQYYWHRFFHHQPDLNYDNPAVQKEVFKIIDYWCKIGVDGFRLDAVPYLFEREGTNCENLPETHVFLKRLRKHVDEFYPGTLLLAEANMWPEESACYFGNGDECHMNYHFPIMPRMFMALQMEDRYPITDIIDQTPAIPEICQWAIFLRNHDELTLEMVTDEERDYMYKVYVKDPKAKINLGIKHRLAPLMENNRRKIELLNYLLFSLPGTPVLYYGDEIGMGDNFYLGDRNGVRTPMQWSMDRNAGFSEANPQKLYLPVILDPQYHYEPVNVELQSKNTSSLLWFMKRLIQTRKKYKAFSWGETKFINAENPKVLAFTRSYKDEVILVVVNLSRYLQPAELDLSAYKSYQLIEAFSKNSLLPVKDDTPYFFTLAQYECQWFELQKPETVLSHKQSLYKLEVREWEQMLSTRLGDELAGNVLPDYLQKIRWFGGKALSMQSIRIARSVLFPLAGQSAILLLLEVSYKSGLPEIYYLPLTFIPEQYAGEIKGSYPQAVVCEMRLGKETGILFDAVYSPEFQKEIFRRMAGNKRLVVNDREEISFSGNKQLSEHFKTHPDFKSKILSAEQSNSSVTYDSTFFLKVYRKVDNSVNPDMEITRFLTEQAGFAHIPAYIGAIEWRSGNGTIVLGMMQEMVGNNVDGWHYMLDQLNNFNEKVLSRPDKTMPEIRGTLLDPVAYANLPQELKELLEASVAERVHQLGVRTAELHAALASSNDITDFKPIEFSLHYQRSLFSSFQTLTRKAFQSLEKSIKKLPEEVKAEAEEVLAMKDDILNRFKRIYAKKLDTEKTRVHGDYHLGQILFAGKDVIILDFEGEPARAYSERRLKRSPLCDVAGMVRSFHYAAYGSLFLNAGIRKEDINKLTPFVELWYHYMRGFFMQAYLHTIQEGSLVPKAKEDLEVLLQTYLLEKAVYELNYELNNRPEWVIIPLRGIKAILAQ